ncbi:hypothetical protein LTR37_014102 [Vermiconidia calcicola]|uniref:Uncharacterized protein n=1 Tax=Vermiconidia calcicola TaxID=1690605 RepID=A0ACC3MV79_9PEZI|nr:hypothetical protein LTR37_014102 [Vermiconidia calcicola]
MPNSSRSKPSRTASSRSRLAPQLEPSSRPGLAVDTSFSRHNGQAPKQVFPYESKTPELSFVSLSDVRALSTNTQETGKPRRGGTLKQRLENKVYVPNSRKKVAKEGKRGTENDHPPPYSRDITTGFQQTQGFNGFALQAPPLHKRIRGLRPEPLELSTDVSPSDRAIPIGIELPSTALSNHTMSPGSTVPYPQSPFQTQSSQLHGQELPTPTILITPAKEDFDLGLTSSPEHTRSGSRRRPSSSMYSSNTNGTHRYISDYERTPPVPPLPLFATKSNTSHRNGARESVVTDFEEQSTAPNPTSSRSKHALSLQTVFEEDRSVTTPEASPMSSRHISSYSNVPTPRRSKGWWNVVMSPFASSAKSTGGFFRSPSLPGDPDAESREPLLSGTSDMPSSERSGLEFSDRGSEGDEIHSAPATMYSQQNSRSGMSRPTPQRSDTAPSALDLGNADALNIYRVPSGGAASAFYDSNRSFPSMIGSRSESTARDVSEMDNWSPSQSVARLSRGFGSSTGDCRSSRGFRDSEIYRAPSRGEAAAYYDPSTRFSSSLGSEDEGSQMADSGRDSDPGSARDRASSGSFSDEEASDDLTRIASRSAISGGSTPALSASRRTLSAAPSEGESDLYSPGYPSATPMVEDAQMGTYMGPLSSNGQPSEVDVASLRTQTPMAPGYGDGLGAATMSSRGPNNSDYGGTASSKTTPCESESQHSRNGYSELGISDAGSERVGSSVGTMSGQTTPHESQHSRNGSSGLGISDAESERVGSSVGTMSGQSTPYGSQHNRNDSSGLGISHSKSRLGTDYGSSVGTMSGQSTPYAPGSQHSRNNSNGLRYSDAGSERALFPPPRRFSEKASLSEFSSFEESSQTSKQRGTGRPWYRRFAWLLAGIVGLLLVLLIVLLAVFVPLHHNSMAVQAYWLNFTGFPPLPIGVATVVRPTTAREINGCVSQEHLWNCAMPTNEGQTTSSVTEPNFRFEIRFRDDRFPSNETSVALSNNTLSRRTLSQASHARDIVRRTAWENFLYSPSPPPPSEDDQIFLGRTTDRNAAPYNGEETPFYISLLDASAPSAHHDAGLEKRDFKYPLPTTTSSNSSSESSKDPDTDHSAAEASTDIADAIPYAAVSGNGGPASAQLYPFSLAQPLRLYNRGQSSEHYGFYTYFDRTLYVSDLSTSTIPDGNSTLAASAASNVPLDDATGVCTWSQTRLLVQIWTQKQGVASLDAAVPTDTPAVDSSANDMTAPGSFPYSVTVTLDRHGGDARQKGVYCHGLDDDHQVMNSVKTWVTENRAFDGKLINPAEVPTGNGTLLEKRGAGDNGGIDGGSGGCECQWQNWQ